MLLAQRCGFQPLPLAGRRPLGPVVHPPERSPILIRGLDCTARATATAEPAVASLPATPCVVSVDLGDRSYPIHIGPGLLDQGSAVTAHIHGSTALVVTNTTVGPLYLDRSATVTSWLLPSTPYLP